MWRGGAHGELGRAGPGWYNSQVMFCRSRGLLLVLLAQLVLPLAGCRYDWDGVKPDARAGGVGGSPGGAGTGGATTGGGVPANGGAVATGGVVADGGVPASAGVSGGITAGSAGAGAPSAGGRGGGAGATLATGGHGGMVGAGGAGGDGGGAGGATGNVCAGNLVQNGGIEAGLTGWDVLIEEGGNRHELAVATDFVPTGSGALLVDTTTVNRRGTATYRLVVASSLAPVHAGWVLSLSATAGAATGQYGPPAIGVQFFDLQGLPIDILPEMVPVSAASPTPIETLTVTVPGAAASARVILELPYDVLLVMDDVCLVR